MQKIIKGRLEMETRMDWPAETAKRMRTCANYYRKSRYDWLTVEAKVQRTWLPDNAAYVLHLYYNG